MIKFEKPEVWGWEHAIRGMRNPLNSWERSDSYPAVDCGKCGIIDREGICHPKEHDCTPYECYAIGDNDKDLMTRLIRGGAPHRKFLRQILFSYRWILPLLSTGGRSSIHTRLARQLIAVPPCTRYRQRSSPSRTFPVSIWTSRARRFSVL